MPFGTLGLSSNASVTDVKLAYRKLAKAHHPDVNPNDPAAAERFKLITVAYTQALLQSTRRASEPQLSSSSVRGSRSAGAQRMRAAASPRTATARPVDGEQFDHREWERNHYGETAQTHFQDERLRMSHAAGVHNMARQRQREAQSMARRARQGSSGGQRAGPSGMVWCLAIGACATVWIGVVKTANSRFRTSR